MENPFGLLYVQKHTFFVDLQVIWLTVIAIVSRERALNGLQHILKKLGANDQLLRVSWRREPLEAYPPPGSDEIVMSRKTATDYPDLSASGGLHGFGISGNECH